MNYQILLPVVSQMLGRDITGDVNLFFRARSAIGASLNEEGQEFFVKNYPSIVDFMETDAGKEAIAVFLNTWVQSKMPKIIANEPATENTDEPEEAVLVTNE